MNERVPDSSGLPLRAMVMVLLFLGAVFLLVAIQSMSSGDDSDGKAAGSSTSAAASATSATTTSAEAPAPQVAVKVYNISQTEGAAARVAEQLRAAHWEIPDENVGNLTLTDIPETTVFYGPEEGQEDAAKKIAETLNAHVAERTPEIAEQVPQEPPSVVVIVTG